MPRSRTLSLSRRLALVVGFGVVFAISAVVVFGKMRRDLEARIGERAELEAERALFRLDSSTETSTSAACNVGWTRAARGRELPSVVAELDQASRARVLAAVERSHEVALVHGHRGSSRFVLAIRAEPDGELRWATVDITEPATLASWRLVAAGFVLLYVLLLCLVIETLVRLRRSTRQLRDAAERLGTDLGSEVAQPELRELTGVADGLRDLSRALQRTMSEHARLTAALEREQRLGTLGRIVAAIAHEVRNPLAAMKLRVDLVREGNGGDAERRRDVEALSEELSRLDRLVTQLLAHVENVELGPCDIGAMVRARVEALRPWADARGVTLVTRGEGQTRADHDALGRAVDNLVRNAVEASEPAGTVHVDVIEDAAQVAIRVDDGGGGLAAGAERNLFEPFFTTKPSGTGLGLSLARATLRAHRGELEYERRDGRSWFTMRLPRE